MMKSIHTIEYHQFCELLIRARKNSNLTQEDLAELLGKPQSYVSKYETCERRLDVVEFVQIARAIGISIQDFVNELDKTI